MRVTRIPEQSHAPEVDGLADSVRALSEAWQSMMTRTTVGGSFNETRREIARWARNTNQAFMDNFGRATASEEIRVILDNLPGLVPSQLGDDGRAFLARTTDEARALSAQAEDALATL